MTFQPSPKSAFTPIRALALLAFASAAMSGNAVAGVVVTDCGAACTATITIGDQTATTNFTLGPQGEIIFNKPLSLSSGGNAARIDTVYGSSDPILGFAVAASTSASAGGTFSFGFSLPVSIAAGSLVNAHAETSYSLTALGASATVSPFNPKTVLSRDVDSSSGVSQSKNVDVGDLFSIPSGGPKTLGSPTYSASSSFLTTNGYDLMSVVVSFNLSKNSTVAESGFVQQTVVPEPTTWAMMIAGLLGVVTIARRRLG